MIRGKRTIHKTSGGVSEGNEKKLVVSIAPQTVSHSSDIKECIKLVKAEKELNIAVLQNSELKDFHHDAVQGMKELMTLMKKERNKLTKRLDVEHV